MSRRSETVLVALAAALAILVIARVPLSWASGNGLNHAAGVWIALAVDLSDGVFYRPSFDAAIGYGGTRYFPLPFAVHAALVRAGLDPIRAGLVLALFAGAGAAAGAFVLLRRLGLAARPALAFAAAALAGAAVQHGLGTIRGDLLPLALELGGLAALAGQARSRRVSLAALLFVLAFAAKPTALAAPFAAAIWLATCRDRGAAARLAGLTLIGAGVVLLGADLLSAGRFLESLRAGATSGMTAGDVLRAPIRLAWTLVRADPPALVTLVAASGILAATAITRRLARRPDDAEQALAPLWLVAALGAAVAVFAAPGTGMNHLAELHAAGIVTLGVLSSRAGPAAAAARAGAGAAAAAGLVVALGLVRADLAGSRLAAARAALADAPRAFEAPILSEDPLVPILAGERPILLDPFMHRLAAERDPALAARLADRIAEGDFAAVILLADAATPDADAWYRETHLGSAAIAAIRARYRLAARHPPYHVYLPVPLPGGDGSEPAARATP